MSPQEGHALAEGVGLGELVSEDVDVADGDDEAVGDVERDAEADSDAEMDAVAVGETLWQGTSQAPVRHSHACTQPTARQRLSHAEPGPSVSARPPAVAAERSAGSTPAAARSARPATKYG